MAFGPTADFTKQRIEHDPADMLPGYKYAPVGGDTFDVFVVVCTAQGLVVSDVSVNY